MPQNQIRRTWHKDQWFYSVLDVITVLTGSKRPDIYWLTLKKRLKSEGFNVAAAQIEYLEFGLGGGRLNHTVAANRKTILRLIQSIPSTKAMPLHQWLAQVGEERLEEMENQARLLERLKAAYRARGLGQDWIEERLRGAVKSDYVLVEWQNRGVSEESLLDILLDEIQKGIFEDTSAEKENTLLLARPPRQINISSLEAALLSLGEATASLFHQDRDSQGFDEIRQDVIEASEVIGEVRQAIEGRLGHSLAVYRKLQPASDKAKQLSLFDAPF